MTPAERELHQIEQRARDLITFADGLEEAGLRTYAQRARATARDVLELGRQLRHERGARETIQAHRDRLDALLTGQEAA